MMNRRTLMDMSLSTKSIKELSLLIKNREIQVIELMHAMLQKINKMNDALNAFITINPEAEAIAHEMDRQLALGNGEGALFGIPIGVKDMVYTRGMRTTMGSKIYEHFVPEKDAEVVKRLKNAGAIMIGKTNTHQFAYGPTGDRSYFGPMRHPYDTTKMAGGSSGGSASSVTAGLCSGSIGTDTSGSIRIPSAFCGLVGMKPTNGSVPVDGVHPLSETLDCVGPMTKNVADNAILLDVLKGNHVGNPFDSHMTDDITDLTVGIPHPFFLDDINEEVEANFRKVKGLLRRAGAKVYDIHIPDVDKMLDAQKIIIAYESYQVHEENVNRFPDDWDPEVKERIEKSVQTKEAYTEALKRKYTFKEIFRTAMKDVDALVTPTIPIPTPDIDQRVIHHSIGDGEKVTADVRSSITRLTAPTNIIGLPSLTLPTGLSNAGLPIGTQLIGKENDEAVLYQIGRVLEMQGVGE